MRPARAGVGNTGVGDGDLQGELARGGAQDTFEVKYIVFGENDRVVAVAGAWEARRIRATPRYRHRCHLTLSMEALEPRCALVVVVALAFALVQRAQGGGRRGARRRPRQNRRGGVGFLVAVVHILDPFTIAARNIYESDPRIAFEPILAGGVVDAVALALAQLVRRTDL